MSVAKSNVVADDKTVPRRIFWSVSFAQTSRSTELSYTWAPWSLGLAQTSDDAGDSGNLGLGPRVAGLSARTYNRGGPITPALFGHMATPGQRRRRLVDDQGGL